uniref:RING-type E3 ubiquitin transferase n=1 Tax=Phallusia mammillata TaxID=59560 RepID=A0A6F9DRU7_9ASCI|nr:E3 ubiquitin-protein ligase RNF126-like [Phallusia mammillata]
MASALATEMYYCYTCDQRISPITEEILCPNCNTGFVEQVHDEQVHDANSDPLHDEMEQDNASGNPVPPQPGSMSNQDMLNMFTTFFGTLPLHMQEYPQSSTQPGPGPARFPRQAARTASDAVPYTGPGLNGTVPQNSEENPARPSAFVTRRRSLNSRQPRSFIDDVLHSAMGADHQIQFPFGGGIFPQWNFMELHGNSGDYAWGPSGLDDIISQLLGQLDNAGPPPASEQTINGLPTIHVDQPLVDSGKECSVCMEAFKLKDEAKKLPCSHFFHIPCIEPWLKLHNTCPICRKLVEDPQCGQPSSSSSAAPSQSGTAGETSGNNPFNFHFFMGPDGNDEDHTYAE